MDVYDTRTLKLVERVQFDAQSLISPSLGYTANGAIPYSDSHGEIAHSIRVYKGKIFLLVSQLLYLFRSQSEQSKIRVERRCELARC